VGPGGADGALTQHGLLKWRDRGRQAEPTYQVRKRVKKVGNLLTQGFKLRISKETSKEQTSGARTGI
jgi:hypothetical protein